MELRDAVLEPSRSQRAADPRLTTLGPHRDRGQMHAHPTGLRTDLGVVALPIAILIVMFVLALVMGPSLS